MRDWYKFYLECRLLIKPSFVVSVSQVQEHLVFRISQRGNENTTRGRDATVCATRATSVSVFIMHIGITHYVLHYPRA